MPQIPTNTTLQCVHGGIIIEILVCYGSKRRTRLALRVKSNGIPELHLPPRVHLHEALPFVQSKASWIMHQMEQMTERQKNTHCPSPHEPTFQTGELHLFQGLTYPLNIHLQTGSVQSVCLEQGSLVVYTNSQSPARVHTLMKRFYQYEAQKYFTMRLHELTRLIPWLTKETLPALRMKILRKRWGSCSKQGVITLNIHLIKLPLSCADLVLMHELAHIQELNHSKHFYSLMDTLMPAWRTYTETLKGYDLSRLCTV